ncbi:MAG: citrate lyase holo-[acyl-carrier protein] synthase [Aristaeellaceae bacterium]
MDCIKLRPVTVADVLSAREARVERQKRMLLANELPLVSFTMNIAGEIKRDEWIEQAFLEGVRRIEAALAADGIAVAARERTLAFTGCEEIWAVDAPAQELKARMCGIEEMDALGRLFDIDVIDAEGRKLERPMERRCLICGGPVRACARSRAHSARELSERAHEIIIAFLNEQRALEIGRIAHRALIREANVTPKPGLVDRENSGAHRDMDLKLFCKSADALLPWFADCARIGLELRDAAPEQVFGRLRKRGIEAEDAMFAATGGVNTHKGALFSLGILCCAAAMEGEGAPVPTILDRAAEIARPALGDLTALRPGDARTGGEVQYLDSGRTGVRGEAAAGFPHARDCGLPALKRALQDGASFNVACLHALLGLMTCVEDSNILRRRGPETLRSVQSRAKALLEKGFSMDDLRRMNDDFVRENLSPGGSADLLAVSIFLYEIQNTDEAQETNGGHLK